MLVLILVAIFGYISATDVNRTQIHIGTLFMQSPESLVVADQLPEWWVQALFAHQVINQERDDILPNHELVLVQKDSEYDTAGAFLGALELSGVSLAGEEEQEVKVILGCEYSGLSMAAQPAASAFDVPMLSPSASSFFLTDVSNYPTFSRISPHDGNQVRALLVICQAQGWTRVAVMNSDDGYNGGLAGEFIAAAPDYGVTIIWTGSFPLGSTTPKSSLAEQAQLSGANIFLIAMYAADATDMFDALGDLNMLEYPYQYLGADVLAPSTTIMEPLFEQYGYQGFIGTNAYADMSNDNPKWTELVEKNDLYSSQVLPLPNNLPVDLSISQITAWAMFFYDAMFFIAHALDHYIQWQEVCDSSSNIPTDFASWFSFVEDGEYCQYLTENAEPEGLLIQSILRSTSMDGVTGSISLNENGERAIADYGVYNWVNGEIRIIGKVNTDTLEVFESLTFAGGNTVPPPDNTQPQLIEGDSLVNQIQGTVIGAFASAVIGSWCYSMVMEESFAKCKDFQDGQHASKFPYFVWASFAVACLQIAGVWGSMCFVFFASSVGKSFPDATPPVTLTTDITMNPLILLTWLPGYIVTAGVVAHMVGQLDYNPQMSEKERIHKAEDKPLTLLMFLNYTMRQVQGRCLLWVLVSVAQVVCISGTFFLTYSMMNADFTVSLNPVMALAGHVCGLVLVLMGNVFVFFVRVGKLRILGVFLWGTGIFLFGYLSFLDASYSYLSDSATDGFWALSTMRIIVAAVALIVVFLLMGLNINNLALSRNAMNIIVINLTKDKKALQRKVRVGNAMRRQMKIQQNKMNGYIQVVRPLFSASLKLVDTLSQYAPVEDAMSKLNEDGEETFDEGTPLLEKKTQKRPEQFPAVTVKQIMANPAAWEIFKDSMLQSHTHESALFVGAVVAYQSVPEAYREAIADTVVETFIRQGAEHQINISARDRNSLVENYRKKKFSRSLFKKALSAVRALITKNDFQRFKQNQGYELVKAIIYYTDEEKKGMKEMGIELSGGVDGASYGSSTSTASVLSSVSRISTVSMAEEVPAKQDAEQSGQHLASVEVDIQV